MSFKKRLLITLAGVVILLAVGVGLLMTFVGKSDKGLTDADLAQLDYVNEKLGLIRDSEEYADMEPGEQMDTMLETINALADEGRIDADSIICDREELYITFEYECGMLGAETFGDDNENFVGGGDSYINRTFDDLNDEEFIGSENPGSAIILDALVDHEDRYDRAIAGNLVSMSEKWLDYGINTKIDYTVTLDDLSHLNGYDYIILIIHGKHVVFETFGKVPMMTINQAADSETTSAYGADRKNGGLAIVNGKYAVTPRFFANHYGSSDSNLDDSILFLVSCNQMGNDNEPSGYTNNPLYTPLMNLVLKFKNRTGEQWSDVYSQIGVSAMVAFRNPVGKEYSIDLLDTFTDHLLNGESASDAFDAAKTKWGVNESEYFSIRYNSEYPFEDPPSIPCFLGVPDAAFDWIVTAEVNIDPPPLPVSDMINDAGYVVFGRYEQDDRGYPYEEYDNGPEPIEWEILSQEDGRMLLISRYIIECQPYNDEYTEVTWAGCSLRQWLNDEFINTAFNEEEIARIQTVTLSNPDNPYTGVEGGIDTTDRVFILSFDEVLQYFDFEELNEDDKRYGHIVQYSDITQYVADTQYARMYGWTYSWWLRTPGEKPEEACYVVQTGVPDYWCSSYDVRNANYGVRPVICISVE